MKSKTLHVLYQSNQTYEVAMFVSICSLLESIREIQCIVLHIVDDGLSTECKNRTNSLESIFDIGIEIDWIDGEEIENRLKDIGVIKQRGAYTTYMKLLVVDTIIKNYPSADRLLYLDSDTLIKREPISLLSLDISECDVFAAYEYSHSIYRQHLGVAGNSVNAGVILINPHNWGKNHCGERVLKLLEDVEYINSLWLHDQDIINQLFKDIMGILTPEYNVNHALYLCRNREKYIKKFRMSEDFYTQESIDKAIKDPVVIHYMDDCWTGMPWDRWNANRWSREFNDIKERHWPSGTICIRKPFSRVVGKTVIVLTMKILPEYLAAEFYYLLSKIVNAIHLV